MKKIPLNKGQFAIVDDEDYEKLIQHRWFVWTKPGYPAIQYAVRSNRLYKYETSTERKMQSHIIGIAPPGHVVDHINWNGLDNRKDNLRIVTYSENNRNRRPKHLQAKP